MGDAYQKKKKKKLWVIKPKELKIFSIFQAPFVSFLFHTR